MKTIGGMCINWKVLTGVAVVGLGTWAIAPNLIGAALPLLLLGACPLSMLLMMRGMGGMGQVGSTQPREMPGHGQAGLTHAEQVTALKARHAVIAREIATLEAPSPQPSLAEGPVRDERGMALNGR